MYNKSIRNNVIEHMNTFIPIKKNKGRSVMSQVISLINEKGGVGKSTSAITISQILAISGYRVLIVDLDPQMNTSKVFGATENSDINYEHLFCEKQLRKESVMDFITETNHNNISLLSASRELNQLIYKIYDVNKERNVELYFRNNLNFIKDEFDYIIIDNSPFKSYLTSCAIIASDKIITPVNVDNFSYDGLMSLFETIEELNKKYSLSIEFAGLFMTRITGRTTIYKQMFEDYEKMFGDNFIPVSIRNSIAVSESNTIFEPLLSYDKKSTAAQDYIELVNYLGLMDNKHFRELAKFLKGDH